MSNVNPLPLRLLPGNDLRRTLETVFSQHGSSAAFVLTGIGSLRQARLRLAGKDEPEVLEGNLEILTLSGTLSPAGAHLHASVADEHGRVMGGHVLYDCVVRTTAEVLVALLPGWSFSRELDQATGYAELVIHGDLNDPVRGQDNLAEPINQSD